MEAPGVVVQMHIGNRASHCRVTSSVPLFRDKCPRQCVLSPQAPKLHHFALYCTVLPHLLPENARSSRDRMCFLEVLSKGV